MTTAVIAERTNTSLADDLSRSEAIEFLVRAAALLFVNGQTTERTMRAIEEAGLSLGLTVLVFLRWGELRVHISNDDDDTSRALIVNPVAVHMGKVAAATKLLTDARNMRGGTAALQDRLYAVETIAPISTARFALMAALGAAALGVIFGASDLASLLLIAASAGAGALLRRWVGGLNPNPYLQPFCAALLSGAVGALVVHLRLDVMQQLVVMCPCMVLVPGPHLLNGTIDLLRTRIAIGAARVTYAGMIVLAICAGLLIGLSLGGVSLPGATISAPPPLAYDLLAAGVAVAAFGAFFSMSWALLPIPMMIGMVAHAARWLVIEFGGSVAAGALVACLIAGAAATPITKRLHLPFAAFGFASVVSLIPGIYLFRTAGGLVELAALGEKAPAAALPNLVADATSAFMIMMAITTGLIVPKMIIDHRP